METGRFADPIINTYFCRKTKQNFIKLSQLMKDKVCSIEIYSSAVPRGQSFKLISSSSSAD